MNTREPSAVHLVGVNLAVHGMLLHAKAADAGVDFRGKLVGFRRHGRREAQLRPHRRQIAQADDRHRVGRDRKRKLTCIIRRAKRAATHPASAVRVALPIRQRLRVRRARCFAAK